MPPTPGWFELGERYLRLRAAICRERGLGVELHQLITEGAMPDYVTVEEAAAMLGYSAEYVRRMLRKGKLRADKKAGVWLIYREAVDAYIEAVRNKAKNDPTRGRKIGA